MTCNKLMAISKIQDQKHLLEVTVVGCYNLAAEYSRVVLEYGGSKKMTKLSSGKHPVFEEKVVFTVGEVQELKIAVWDSQPLGNNGILGYSRIELQQVLSDGYVDSSWTLKSIDGRYSGDIRLVLQLPNYTRHDTSYTMPAALTPSSPPVQQNLNRPATFLQHIPYGSAPSAPEVPQPSAPDYDVPYPCTTYPPYSAPVAPYLYPHTRPMRPNASQPATLYQLLPYGGSSPPAPAVLQPTAPAYNFPYPCSTYPPQPAPAPPSPYPPATQPISCYQNPRTPPPAGYYSPHPHQKPTYYPPPSGSSSAVYPPPQR